jgi:ribosomal protein S18 acetylase RimI-like enzyme
MHAVELSRLALTPAESDADLEAMIEVRKQVTPEARPSVENLRHNLETDEDLAYVVVRLDDEPVACGYVEPSSAGFAVADIAVVPARRRRGIGATVFADLSVRARALGKDELQFEVRESDAESRAFLERRGYTQVGAEKAVSLELAEIEAPAIEPPPAIRIVSRVEEPELLEGMYAVCVEAEAAIPGSIDVRTFEAWKAHEIDKPSRRPELCFAALSGDEVVGYAALHVFGDVVYHGLTAVKRAWRRRGVATALKQAEIAAAKEAGFGRLVTESEERNLPMRRLNEKLGFRPCPEQSVVVMRGPLV